MKLLAAILVTIASAFCLPLHSAEAKPNIVFLLADDLGGADVHCYGHPYSKTPRIDKLAGEGTRFMQFYATGATSYPARTGLMTSKFSATHPTYPANGGVALPSPDQFPAHLSSVAGTNALLITAVSPEQSPS